MSRNPLFQPQKTNDAGQIGPYLMGRIIDESLAPDLTQRLLAAIKVSASSNAASMEAVRVAVSEFTLALRHNTITPEAVLISLKSVINDRALPSFPRDPSERDTIRLREQISTWCIEAYFTEKTGSG